jgi:cellulose synthase (UDP-forming)
MGIMYLLPVAAVALDIHYAAVTWPDYVLHATPPALALLVLAWTQRALGVFRPVDARVLGWERVLFVLLQWPWVAWGCAIAMRDWLTGCFVEFRVTPKGEAARGRLPYRVVSVYVVLALGCLLPVLLVDHLEEAKGFYLLTLITALLYAATAMVIVFRHLSENHWTFSGRARDALLQFGTLGALVVLTLASLALRLAEGTYALTVGAETFHLVEVRYLAAGAGNPSGQLNYEWTYPWN